MTSVRQGFAEHLFLVFQGCGIDGQVAFDRVHLSLLTFFLCIAVQRRFSKVDGDYQNL